MATPAPNDLPTLDYKEVGRHNSKSSAYVVYNDLVFDITAYLRQHPGGAAILQVSLGTDITTTLDSFHDFPVSKMLQSANFQARNGIKLVGRLNNQSSDTNYYPGLHEYQSRRLYDENSEFWKTTRSEVFSAIKKNNLPIKKSLPECLLLLAIFYSSYLATIYTGFVAGAPLLCLLLGPIATLMAVNVGHTVMHGAFSRNGLINLIGRGLGDASGYSSSCWDVEHQIHHQAPHTQIDLQTAPSSGVKFFEHQKSEWHQKYQMFYMWFLFTIYSPVSWVVHSYRTLFVYPSVTTFEKAHHVVFKFFGFALPIGLSFYVNAGLTPWLCLAAYSVSMSYASIFSLFIQHEESYLPENENESWAVRQVRTSVSWRSSSRLFEWLFGYFNYHIEHHLFPGINPSLYPKIQPIVKRNCRKYGVTYKDVSYRELFVSQFRAWKKFSASVVKQNEQYV